MGILAPAATLTDAATFEGPYRGELGESHLITSLRSTLAAITINMSAVKAKSSSIDPAILRALSISSSEATMKRHGGSGFTSTYRLITPTIHAFVKTSYHDESSRVMLEGEYVSLRAIHDALPSLVPRPLAHGRLENDEGGYFLAMEFLDLAHGFKRSRSASHGDGSGMSLAEKLAKLHSVTAPVPEGFDQSQFGFSVTTCCGDTPQDNLFCPSWAEFFGKNRLLAVFRQSEKRNGKDSELRSVIERAVSEVVPKLLGDGHLGGGAGIKPVMVHGDLWSGNRGSGRKYTSAAAPGPVEELIFDPAGCYAHNEFEFGIMKMFGGFSSSFFEEYHKLVPITEPREEYNDRISLYESYHHLNHAAIFGHGGYRSGAMTILERLIKKYGAKG